MEYRSFKITEVKGKRKPFIVSIDNIDPTAYKSAITLILDNLDNLEELFKESVNCFVDNNEDD